MIIAQLTREDGPLLQSRLLLQLPSDGALLGVGTEYLPHHADQLEGTAVRHAVEDAVGFLAGLEDALVAENGEVLGDVAL